ncbi:MAG: YicC family protein [Bacteroidales bacterium]|nr:YicC family protein [Bacteroidales bacterium]
MMIKSMTGYGKSEATLENGKLTIEFRSVNGKNADISIKSSLLPKEKELDIRRRIAEKLQRGTIDMFLTWEPNTAESAKKINVELAREYYSQISELGASIGAESLNRNEPNYLLATLLRMPDVIDSTRKDVITDENWPLVEKAIDEALDRIDTYRSDEGVSLYKDVTGRVQTILSLYDEIEQYEPERISAARERILKAAEELKVKMDEQRFEQEMIFYLEKLDINEEKVRLRQHCKYFMDTIDSEPYPGKKLGFIIQEMGREINTTGSKANHASIQKCVVRMKDELEKIREQSMNIL